jgi:hypothetical protein
MGSPCGGAERRAGSPGRVAAGWAGGDGRCAGGPAGGVPAGLCGGRGVPLQRQPHPAAAQRGYRPAGCCAAVRGVVSVCHTARPARRPAGGATTVGVVGARQVPGLGAARCCSGEPVGGRTPAAGGAGRDARGGRLLGAQQRGAPDAGGWAKSCPYPPAVAWYPEGGRCALRARLAAARHPAPPRPHPSRHNRMQRPWRVPESLVAATGRVLLRVLGRDQRPLRPQPAGQQGCSPQRECSLRWRG